VATYLELYALRNNQQLLEKVSVAIVKACQTIRGEAASVTNHANRLKWAKEALADPAGMAQRMIWVLLAANSALTTTQIQNATDAGIQNEVDATVDLMAQG